MPAKRKTKEISKTDRESTKQATLTPAEQLEQMGLTIELTPVQMHQINVIAQIAHHGAQNVYCRHITLKPVTNHCSFVDP